MANAFIQELQWRGLYSDSTPQLEDHLNKESTRAYIGFDPTADSLHIGNLVAIMLLVHFQQHGHQPIVLVGGATGMVGDPSGKSKERNLLDEATLQHNLSKIKTQLSRFLSFEQSQKNAALVVNNLDWFQPISFLSFIRDIGKHITINYMMAKDSVKKRLESDNGISFTEFTYQLLQGYDFLHLFEHHCCTLQMGGSDQWGNITTGIELIRKKTGKEAFALTCPLLKKADGGKFGKTESGNIWLDETKTSPYIFYQFWLNISDEDAKSWIKIFTFLDEATIKQLIQEHDLAPHQRILQKRIAQELTIFVHNQTAFEKAIITTDLLFGNGNTETLQQLNQTDFLHLIQNLPLVNITKQDIEKEITIIDLLCTTQIFPSKSEAKKMLANNGISINKQKIDNPETSIGKKWLLFDEYILIQKGKKNYVVVKIL